MQLNSEALLQDVRPGRYRLTTRMRVQTAADQNFEWLRVLVHLDGHVPPNQEQLPLLYDNLVEQDNFSWGTWCTVALGEILVQKLAAVHIMMTNFDDQKCKYHCAWDGIDLVRLPRQ